MSDNIGYTATLDNGPFLAGLNQLRTGMEGLRSLAAPLMALAAGFAGAATAGEILKKSMDEAAEHEQLTTSFVTLLGSVDAAKSRMKTPPPLNCLRWPALPVSWKP